MSKSLFDRFMSNFGNLALKQIYNPLEAKIGDKVQINGVDYEGYSFTIKELIEYEFSHADGLNFVDYCLKGKPYALKGEDIDVRLRVSPHYTATTVAPKKSLTAENMQIDVFYLQLSHEHEHDAGLEQLLKEEKAGQENAFNLDFPDHTDTYWRLHNALKPHEFALRTVNIANVDKDSREFKIKYTEFWDWHRDVNDVKEYLFIEMDKETGWFQFFKGVELNPKDVITL